MRLRVAVLLLVPLGVLAASDAALAWFRYLRPVQVAAPGRQNYFVVDAALWSAARPDLGDLRLYREQREAPYALAVKHGERRSTRTPARLLNLGTQDGRTHFLLETEAPEYDRVHLDLDARDFVAEAVVEGREDLQAGAWTRLAASTLYDFSAEQLGSSSVLKLPVTRYRYLRVRISGPVRPQNVRSASVENVQEEQARWTAVEVSPTVRQEGKTTVIVWQHPRNVPLERLRFDVVGANFRREVALRDAENRSLASGHISRIRMRRHGEEISSEDLQVDVSGVQPPEARELRLVIDNGDDLPLDLRAVRLFMTERRVYFDPAGATSLTLYYGDPQLGRPEYDYSKLFHEDEDAARAALGASADNAAYTGRPDRRPWSERHPVVLWGALIVAVLGLGALAFRAMRQPGA